MATDEQGMPMGRPVGVSSEEIASHDEEAFADALLDALRPALRALRAMGLSEDDTADVLQDASIRAWRHRSQRRGEFAAWFVAIAYHEARRPRRRWPAIPVFWQGASGAPVQEGRSDGLDRALARLPRRQRTAISLRYGSDLTIVDVASTLGISEPAAKQLLARARESLRRTLSSIPRGEP
jgi:RNA polymerase sigma factor (sigma-70 family)